MARSKQTDANLVALFIRVPDEVNADLELLAEKEEISKSRLCTKILKRGLDKYEVQTVPSWMSEDG
jgi:predicted transcriptional regulator